MEKIKEEQKKLNEVLMKEIIQWAMEFCQQKEAAKLLLLALESSPDFLEV